MNEPERLLPWDTLTPIQAEKKDRIWPFVLFVVFFIGLVIAFSATNGFGLADCACHPPGHHKAR